MPRYKTQRRACTACRRQKKRCSAKWPCTLCQRLEKACIFDDSSPRGAESTPVQEDAQDLCGTDLTGNILEPASPYSWLHRARLRLGNVKSQLRDPLAKEDSATSIFCYGDSVPIPDQQETIGSSLAELPWGAVLRLVQIYFERAMVTYHFLHGPTVIRWLEQLMSPRAHELDPQKRCIATLVLSHGALYATPEDLHHISLITNKSISSEALYKLAVASLDHEHGQPTMESVQARLIQTHHLLSSARPNQAWYIFGHVVQLAWALGLHRATSSKETSIIQQLHRRTFWSIYTTDKYISIAVGRPMLVHDDTISQKLPSLIDDDDLEAEVASGAEGKDCSLSATIYHNLLSRIVAKGISEQNETNANVLLQAVSRNQKALDSWRASLPAFLSGQVHPSSLIPKFQRQSEVVRIFYLNAVILINRPLLVLNLEHHTSIQQYQKSVQACLASSKELASEFVQFCKKTQTPGIHWFTQNITFNAISILYFYLLRSLQMNCVLSEDDRGIFDLAQNAFSTLQRASETNAPSFRYCLVLDELRKEVQLSAAMSASSSMDTDSMPVIRPLLTSESSMMFGTEIVVGSSQSNSLPQVGDFDFEESFWPWFDTLPSVL